MKAITWPQDVNLRAHKGEFMGIPPTGENITVKGVNIYHSREGKISEFWATLDELGMRLDHGLFVPEVGPIADGREPVG